MTGALIIFAIAGVVVLAWLAYSAPEGWQDDNGWHAGPEPDNVALQLLHNRQRNLAQAFGPAITVEEAERLYAGESETVAPGEGFNSLAHVDLNIPGR